MSLHLSFITPLVSLSFRLRLALVSLFDRSIPVHAFSATLSPPDMNGMLYLQGFHGDNCATVGVGTVDAAGQRLMDATEVTNSFARMMCTL